MIKISIVALGFILLLTKEIHAGEKSLYDFLWLDPDKKVYVLQNKEYKKEHSFYADIGYISNFTSKFQETQGYQLKSGYYFHEEWGVELFYNRYLNSNNDDYRNVQLVNSSVPFVRKLNSSYGALAVWSPFYGKINTFNQIYYFDWSFAAGLTKINAESNLKSVTNSHASNTYYKEKYNGAVLKTNLKFHLKENLHLGIDYMNTYYKAPGPSNPHNDKLRTNTDVIFSIGFSY
ncbi:MAG: outer membrane beta-barrel domain-containing protein [Bacteriovoracaceae bacterium]